jgi:protein-S-isoprenylcysteine O-methyltransferase Ste14
MTEYSLIKVLLAGMVGLSALTAATLCVITAPYGRHRRGGFGPTIPSTLGWVVMEAPAPLVFLFVYMKGEHRGESAPLFLLALFCAHYLQRAFVYPFLRRGGGAPMPILVVASGFIFNVLNGYLNARFISHFSRYAEGWLGDPRFVVGVVLFGTGFFVNRHADAVLARLRAPGDTGYKIPNGGLYRLISAPNYFGEIVEWFGFALASFQPAGLAFALFTVANLAPRAAAHHRWYRAEFADYPRERRALIPYLW